VAALPEARAVGVRRFFLPHRVPSRSPSFGLGPGCSIPEATQGGPGGPTCSRPDRRPSSSSRRASSPREVLFGATYGRKNCCPTGGPGLPSPLPRCVPRSRHRLSGADSFAMVDAKRPIREPARLRRVERAATRSLCLRTLSPTPGEPPTPGRGADRCRTVGPNDPGRTSPGRFRSVDPPVLQRHENLRRRPRAPAHRGCSRTRRSPRDRDTSTPPTGRRNPSSPWIPGVSSRDDPEFAASSGCPRQLRPPGRLKTAGAFDHGPRANAGDPHGCRSPGPPPKLLVTFLERWAERAPEVVYGVPEHPARGSLPKPGLPYPRPFYRPFYLSPGRHRRAARRRRLLCPCSTGQGRPTANPKSCPKRQRVPPEPAQRWSGVEHEGVAFDRPGALRR